jgi:hypothetical protein
MFKDFQEHNVSEALRRIIGLTPRASDDNTFLKDQIFAKIYL